jgi:hypothetical protein
VVASAGGAAAHLMDERRWGRGPLDSLVTAQIRSRAPVQGNKFRASMVDLMDGVDWNLHKIWVVELNLTLPIAYRFSYKAI